MMLIKNVFLGWFKGLVHFDPVILVCTGVLIAFIGFPEVSNSVLRNPSLALDLVPDPMKKLVQEPLQDQRSDSVIKSREEKQKFEIQRKEASLLREAKSIPSSHYQDNLNIYQKLSKLRPNNKRYRSKVNFYKQRVEDKRIAKAKAIKEQRSKAERLAKKKAARENALIQKALADKLKVEELKKALRRSKWRGSVAFSRNGKIGLTDQMVTVSFDKNLKCKFSIAEKENGIVTKHNNRDTFNPNALMAYVVSSLVTKKSTYTQVVENSIGEFTFNIKGLDRTSKNWSPNGKWTVKLFEGKVLLLLNLNEGIISVRMQRH